jgi:RNA polymerase sigma factor (TIGR02999 family)
MSGATDPDGSLGEITILLNRAEAGDKSAAEMILPLVYGELRKLAAAKMAREPAGMTLQATALVHEAWLRLGADKQPSWHNRAQFFAASAEAMRRILIESARRRSRLKHGGELEKVSADETPLEIAAPVEDEELLAVHEAVDALERHDPRKAQLVKYRYFAGLEFAEIAEIMQVSERTAKRDWDYARAWLFKEIKAARK